MFHARHIAAPALCLAALVWLTSASFAAWPHDPSGGQVAISTAIGDQLNPRTLPDDAGGALVVWEDHRGADIDLYAQRVTSAGQVAWATNGIVVCNAVGDQVHPRLVSDGAGGMIVTWEDHRAGNADVYAQHVKSTGVVDAAWPANGRLLCTATGDQDTPESCTDGAGGAIVTWWDTRLGAGNTDIYAQRVTAAGTIAWAATGAAVCTNPALSDSPVLCSDTAGGAFIAWEDNRNGSIDIFAQRVNGAGAALWTSNGVALENQVYNQFLPAITADGYGGAIVAWRDARINGSVGTPSNGPVVFAQRLTPTGAGIWAVDGVQASASDAGSQVSPGPLDVRASGDGGAILLWDSNPNQALVQRLSAAGLSLWGQAVHLGFSIGSASMVADGSGGALVAYDDFLGLVSVGPDILAQRIDPGGQTAWPAYDFVSHVAFTQNVPSAAPDGAGGMIVVWQDLRGGVDFDLYAQRAEHYGNLGNPEPASAGVKDVRNDQGGFVKVSWTASYLDADPTYGVVDYRLWRSVPTASAIAPGGVAAASVRPTTGDADQAAATGALLLAPQSTTGYAWEYVSTTPAAALPAYSAVAATGADSVLGSNPRTAFMVEARASTALGAPHWFSAPDSGYSVDNLPPAAVTGLAGQYVAGLAQLHWNANTEPDLAGYRLYRGTPATFTPGPANLLATLGTTSYSGPEDAVYTFKLTAVDTHGNESAPVAVTPGGITGVGDGAAVEFALAEPSPNPARGDFALRFALSRAGRARLAVYDVAGRVALVAADAVFGAGAHEARLSAGALRAGLYFVRLDAAEGVRVARLVVTR